MDSNMSRFSCKAWALITKCIAAQLYYPVSPNSIATYLINIRRADKDRKFEGPVKKNGDNTKNAYLKLKKTSAFHGR